jgi:hypothetical protein
VPVKNKYALRFSDYKRNVKKVKKKLLCLLTYENFWRIGIGSLFERLFERFQEGKS